MVSQQPMNQPQPIDSYRREVTDFAGIQQPGLDAWCRFYNWYQNAIGRSLFIQAFQHETNIRVQPRPDLDRQIQAAIPKSWSDYDRKTGRDPYYQAHAEMFLAEMDSIVSRITSGGNISGPSLSNAIRFIQRALLDSLVLFQDYGTHNAGVPDVFKVYSSQVTTPMALYHGARQIIYGHGTDSLSYADNHSELAATIIRQAIEIRLRRGFGLVGKELISNGSFQPVPLSTLLEVLRTHASNFNIPISVQNLIRINGWANLLLHSGVRDYSWTSPRVLEYLKPFLIGEQPVGGANWSIHSGIQLTRSSFRQIQTALESAIETPPSAGGAPRYKALLVGEDGCDVVFED